MYADGLSSMTILKAFVSRISIALPWAMTLLLVSSLVVGQSELEVKQATINRLVSEGVVLRQAGDRQSLEDSIKRFIEALTVIRSINDQLYEARIRLLIGTNYRQLGDSQRSLEYLEQALQLFRAIGNHNSEAVTLNTIGDTYAETSNYESAVDSYSQAVSVRQAMRDRIGEALSLINIGLAYSTSEQSEKALDSFKRSLSLCEAEKHGKCQAVALSNIGVVYNRLGEDKEAFDYLMRALLLRRSSRDREGEVATLEALGGFYNGRGEKQKALDYYKDSLSIAEDIRDTKSKSTLLNNIAGVYSSLGEPQRALDYFFKALALKRQIGDQRGEAVTLNNIGDAYRQLDELDKAFDRFNQARELFHRIHDYKREATTYNNLGAIQEAQRRKQEALDSYSKALSVSRAAASRLTEAAALNNIAGILDESGEKEKALEHYEQALVLLRELGDRRHQATTLSNIATLEAGRENLKEAFQRVNEAIDILESLRRDIVADELRSSFFASVHNHYEFLISLLIRLHKQDPSRGYEEMALQTSERARARGLLELLNDSHAQIRKDVDPRLLEQERSLQQRLNAKAASRTFLLSRSNSAEEALATANDIEKLTTEYQDVKAKIRKTNPRYAALTQPQPLNLKKIRTELDANTLLLEYALGDVQSFLWLVSATELKTYELPKRREIEALCDRYYELITTTDARNTDLTEIASRLSQMLLGPVTSKLGRKRLVIVADGALQYLPFAAFPEPGLRQQTPIVVRHEIIYLPSFSVLASLRSEALNRKPAAKDIMVLADPVFSADDKRVKTGSLQGIASDRNDPERLPATRREAEGIVALAPLSRTKKALDFAANRELVESGELSKYRYVVFATHGFLDSLHPELSAIVLSLVDENGNRRDGYLRAHEVYNLNLSAELVVLSACETALGKNIKGEGLIGLTRGFIYAGSPRVMASLWPVKDDSTAVLMVSFFRSMIKQGKRPAAALRATQIEMLKSNRWSAPHYWAAFVLQGEWR
jgi:CHAT domain-containing protein/Tfp pilus assembly protein PilF